MKKQCLKKTFIAISVIQAFSLNITSAATIDVTNRFDLNAGCTLREATESINNGEEIHGCQNIGNSFGSDDIITFRFDSVSNLGAEIEIRSDVSTRRLICNKQYHNRQLC